MFGLEVKNLSTTKNIFMLLRHLLRVPGSLPAPLVVIAIKIVIKLSTFIRAYSCPRHSLKHLHDSLSSYHVDIIIFSVIKRREQRQNREKYTGYWACPVAVSFSE